MADDQEIKLNDVGTVFEVTLMDGDAILPISAPISMIIYLKKPSGTVMAKTAVLTTDGSDGKIQYVAIAGDLDELKGWSIQGRVELTTGHWSSSIDTFIVGRNLWQ